MSIVAKKASQVIGLDVTYIALDWTEQLLDCWELETYSDDSSSVPRLRCTRLIIQLLFQNLNFSRILNFSRNCQKKWLLKKSEKGGLLSMHRLENVWFWSNYRLTERLKMTQIYVKKAFHQKVKIAVFCLCIVWKKWDSDQSTTGQRASKKSKILIFDSTLLRSVYEFDRGQPNCTSADRDRRRTQNTGFYIIICFWVQKR